MKWLASVRVGVGVLPGAASYLTSASGEADGEAAPIYGVKIPPGFRDWQLISVNHLTGANLKQVRAHIGNYIAMRAFREGKLPFPDGAIIAALHWKEDASDENNKVLAAGFPGAGLQS